MDKSSNFIDSKEPQKENSSSVEKIKDVYIGVFFDGTNNNMLWTAKDKIKKYRDKLKKTYGIENGPEQFGQKVSNVIKIQDVISKTNIFDINDLDDVEKLSTDKIENIIESHREEYDIFIEKKKSEDTDEQRKEYIKEKIKKIDKETSKADRIVDNHTILEDEWADFVKLQLSKEDKCRALKKGNYHYNCNDCKIKSHECKLLNDKDELNNTHEWIIKNYKDNKNFFGKDAIRQYKNAHTTYKPTMCGGFSNIAILYSAYNPIPKEHSNQYKIYIEGSGATDISEKHFLKPEILEKMNINGLGFGLGETGVVALVSKAVFYVNNYIESIKSTFQNETVNIHFNVFGFSRGATCSRLFSYLVTRATDDSLEKREKEFADFYAKRLYYKKDNEKNEKLHFLENKEYNKTVDFLGIYDTVVSIGFLLQKDGFVHPLAVSYKFADNYIANWHCNNVSEYGMYSTSSNYEHNEKIKNILHICAMDEYRENFAITDVGKKVGKNALEIFIPGCHSDVGGGYYDGDEEQEILLQKKIKKGKYLTEEEWNKRRQSNEVVDRKANSNKRYQFIGKKQDDDGDDERLKNSLIRLGWIDENWDKKECASNKRYQFIGKKQDDDGDDERLKNSLIRLGWIDENWDKKECAKIRLNGAVVPCTIRVVNGPKNLKFKRNVKAGYSNIPLNMMMTYAENKMNQFTKLFDIEYITNEYPIPSDLNNMKDDVLEKMKGFENGQRCWLHPKEEDYKKLRMKYLHFTSTYRLFHTNNPFSKDVKTFEGSPGNIANTPNQDLDGRICRIVYHGDKDDYNLNYMYQYGEGLGKVHGDISVPITFTIDKENKD